MRGGGDGFERLAQRRCACGLANGGDTFRQQGRNLDTLGHGRHLAKQPCYRLVVQALGFGEGQQALEVWHGRIAGDDIHGLPQGHHLHSKQSILRRGKPLPLQFEHVTGEELGETPARTTVAPGGRGFCVRQSSPD